MADLQDVCDYLVQVAASAAYPNGTSQSSVAGMDIRIMEGWPLPEQLDRDLGGTMLSGTPPAPVPRPGGPCADISVYPMPGATAVPFQILDDTYTIVPPVYGITIVSVVNGVITCSGAPGTGEYLTCVIDRAHVISSTQPTLSALLADLATQAITAGYAASSTATTLTIPYTFELDVRLGAVGTLAFVTWRQRQGIMVSVWAPDHTSRATIASAIDNLIKQTLVVVMPDTSQAKITYSRTNQTDEYQTVTLYRRDLIYEAEYATLEQFPGYVITSVTFNIQGGNWGLPGAPPPTVPPTITVDP